ncbi:MAG UNVERIFIED_CONTAM: hypothetical protein LVR29_15750 [Microcystis novacekii LVE1205-3]|jgi:hypothetical protein
MIKEDFMNQIKLITEKILSGSYGREKDQDWLYHADGRKINLIDASSGQQEALPMLLILLVFPFLPLTNLINSLLRNPKPIFSLRSKRYGRTIYLTLC